MSPGRDPPASAVEVALPLPVSHTFTYRVPDNLRERAVPGARVLVPIGRKQRIGWIDRPSDGPPAASAKPLDDVLDERPAVPEPLLRLCRWVADYYVAPLGQVLRAALPAGLSDVSRDLVSLVHSDGPLPGELTDLERTVVEWLAGREEPQPVARLRRERGKHSWWPVIRRLQEWGIVAVEREEPRTDPPVRTRRLLRITDSLPTLGRREEVFGRARRQRELYEVLEEMGGTAETAHLAAQLGFSHTVLNGLVGRGVAIFEEEEVSRDPYAAVPIAEALPIPPLTPAQEETVEVLLAAARAQDPGTFLLHGVTGSGKTRVYVELLREVVEAQGRGAIVLVPEIALTPQTVARFRAAFGDRVAVLHSALSDGERLDEWRALRSGEKRVVVGARSAVFAPVEKLGAIVVDEEHESSYKQGDSPRYHAREVAVVRARLAGAVCLLGSATPAAESWRNASDGKYRLLTLPDRVGGAVLPSIRVVDRSEGRDGTKGASLGPEILSEQLEAALAARLERGEQSILLLNRRGYATFVRCHDCGEVWECPSCSVSLTYHRRRARLVCHYCFHEEAAPQKCTRCGSTDVGFRGVGTEQVEREVGEHFPAASLARMDVDTTSGKWSHHRILERVERGEVDILLGTQMIAKGLDFPNVTLVGVINADVGLHLPDFRATERTFQLLTQVAGRSGRGRRPGEVIVQTAMPDHYAVRSALRHDYHGFIERELEERREPGYPPFTRMVNLVVSGRDEGEVRKTAVGAADWIGGLVRSEKLAGVSVLGPAPCPIERIRARWRWHLLLRSGSARLLGEVCRYFSERYTVRKGRHDLRLAIDRDPVALL